MALEAQFFSNSHLPEVNDAVADFVSRRIWGRSGEFGPRCTMGVVDNGQLVAGVVYHNYYPKEGTIEVSAASDTRRWLTRDILRAFISMPFEKLGVQALIARHAETAQHLRRMWQKVGALEYTIPRLRGKDQPAECISVLTDDAWAASPFNRSKA